MIWKWIREKAKEGSDLFSFSPRERIALLLFFLVFFLFQFYGHLTYEQKKEIKLVPLQEGDGYNGSAYQTKLDINQAPWYELCLLPGVGDSIARRILEYRRHYGGFEKIDDLIEIKGIGKKTLDALRPFVCIGGREDEGESQREQAEKAGQSCP